MKKIISLLAILVIALGVKASTIVPAGNVSGVWTLAGSPYIVTGDIQCNTTLVIQPGVDVRFQMSGLTVYGGIKAIGTAQQPVIFESDDTTGWSNFNVQTGGTKGLFIYGNATDSSVMDHCILKDCKGANWGCYCLKVYTQHFILSNSEVYHNYIYWESYILNFSSNSPQIINNSIHDNISSYGAGIVISNTDALVSGNEIYNNTGTIGVIYCSGVRNQNGATIINNYIHDNHNNLYSCGIEVESCSQVLIKNNKIAFNHTQRAGGGIDVLDSHPKIISNWICNNTDTANTFCGVTDGGGGILVNNAAHNDTAEIYNNVIANNNSFYRGGGIRITGSGGTAFIENNTIVNNTTTGPWGMGSSGLEVSANAHARIKNNILAGNRSFDAVGTPDSTQLFISQNDTIVMEYNFIDVCHSGGVVADPSAQINGNQSSNIQVAGLSAGIYAPTLGAGVTYDATQGDWHLMVTSPCVDAGTTISLSALPQPVDIYNNPRIVNTLIDIGAAEYSSANGIIEHVAATTTIFPNPANAILYLNNGNPTTEIQITDVLGNVVMNLKYENGIDVSSLSPGIYFLSFQDEKGNRSTERFVKQ